MSILAPSPLTPPYALPAPGDDTTTQLLAIEAEDAAIMMGDDAISAAQAAYEEELNVAIGEVATKAAALITHSKAVIKFLARIEIAIGKDMFNPKLLASLSCVDAMVDTLTDAVAEYGVALHTSKDFITYDGDDEEAVPQTLALVSAGA